MIPILFAACHLVGFAVYARAVVAAWRRTPAAREGPVALPAVLAFFFVAWPVVAVASIVRSSRRTEP